MKITRSTVVLLLLIITVGSVMLASVRLDQAEAQPVDVVAARWTASTHSNAKSEAFVNWDEEEPPMIPQRCAACHSTYGYLDYLGADGSEAGTVDAEAKTGSVVYCVACHNPEAEALTQVAFPSGEEVTGLGPEARCSVCHQGRRSTDDVAEALAGLDDDEVSQDLGFINVHYAIAAAIRWGGQVRGGYQYAGLDYVGRFPHVETFDTCDECHDPHSQQVNPDMCSPCHLNVVNYADLRDIRERAVDYDGNGDIEEGIAGELEALQQALYAAMQAYAASVIGTPIIYADAFPYFFIDTNGNGQPDEGEATFGNQYADWTPRLVRVTYNYHVVQQDPGAYAHNPAYVAQLLYDSLNDLGEWVTVDLDAMARPTVAAD
jgi:cytochrome c553